MASELETNTTAYHAARRRPNRPDGSGSAAAQIVAVFQGAPAITASDITVI